MSACETAVPFCSAVRSKTTAALSATCCDGVEYAVIDSNGALAPVAPVAPWGPVGPCGPVAPVGAVTYGICLFVCPRKSAGAFEMNL